MSISLSPVDPSATGVEGIGFAAPSPHSMQTGTFLPSTLGRCRVASVSVISSSLGLIWPAGPTRTAAVSTAIVSFAAPRRCSGR